MDVPTFFEPQKVTSDIYVLRSYFPVPGLGILPVNAFLLLAKEPVLVDTGLVPLSEAFLEALGTILDPTDLKWLWLTHTDQDHIGSLWPLIEAVPGFRIVTTFLAMGKMSLYRPLPPDRVYLLNPGQSLDVGDRRLMAIKPPTFDAPETTGFLDPGSQAFFCADCFGAVLSDPADSAAAISPSDLESGLKQWGTIDAPWVHMVPSGLFRDSLTGIRDFSPKWILSSHLPPAQDMTDRLLSLLATLPESDPFIGPDQKALEEMMSMQDG